MQYMLLLRVGSESLEEAQNEWIVALTERKFLPPHAQHYHWASCIGHQRSPFHKRHVF